MRTITVLGLVVVVGIASACKGRSSSSGGAPAASEKAFAADTLPVDAIERSGAICERLVTAGVAKSCVKAARTDRVSGFRGPIAWISTFEPVGGFAKDKCKVRVDVDEKEFKGFAETLALANIPPDDFPRSIVYSTPAAMWHASVQCDAGVDKGNKWDVCREKKAVDACAKLFPAEYAKYRALREASTRIVDGR